MECRPFDTAVWLPVYLPRVDVYRLALPCCQGSHRRLFESYCEHLAIDTKLAKRLAQYQAGFRTRNEDHIRFFGGKLLGVEVVRFLPRDRDAWFEEILQADDSELTGVVHDLPSIDPSFYVSSDAMNLSCAWLLHRLQNSHLSAKEKTEAMVNVGLILSYKYLTSLLSNYFKYPADRATAEAAYASLSNKFLIKKYGSWYALLRAFAEHLIDPKGLWWDVIVKMHDDKRVVDMVNDIQGRIRSIVKNIYAEFMLVHKQGIRITSTSAVVTFDKDEILRDKTKGLAELRAVHPVGGG